jgi:hypothetical protein
MQRQKVGGTVCGQQAGLIGGGSQRRQAKSTQRTLGNTDGQLVVHPVDEDVFVE